MNNKTFHLMLARKCYECALLWRKAGQTDIEAMDMTEVRHYLQLSKTFCSTCVKLP